MTYKNPKAGLMEQASAWVTILESGDASREDRAAFEEWRRSSPQNHTSYEFVTGVWRDVGEMSHLAQLEPLAKPMNGTKFSFLKKMQRLGTAPVHAGRRFALACAVALVIGMSGYAVWQPFAGPSSGVYETRVAEIRELTLRDGSVVTLGAKSRLDVAFTDAERYVKLQGGEAFFSVTKDAERPFIVEAEDTLIRVVGTKFNVHSGMNKVTVGVIEGKVEVIKPHPAKPTHEKPGEVVMEVVERRQLTAGQQVSIIAQGAVEEIRSIEMAEPGSWLTGRLSYQDATVRELIYDVTRYSAIDVELADPSIGDMTVTMSFRAQDINEMFDALASVLFIEVDRREAGQIILKLPERAAGQDVPSEDL